MRKCILSLIIAILGIGMPVISVGQAQISLIGPDNSLGVDYLVRMNKAILERINERKLDYWIDKLSKCESDQIPDNHIIDSNDEWSFGWLQFQSSTFNSFGGYYNLPHDDIQNPEQQIKIAKKMLKDGLWKHWKNCGKRIGLDKINFK